jgi:predicted RNA-binding protein with RPS1 domain
MSNVLDSAQTAPEEANLAEDTAAALAGDASEAVTPEAAALEVITPDAASAEDAAPDAAEVVAEAEAPEAAPSAVDVTAAQESLADVAAAAPESLSAPAETVEALVAEAVEAASPDDAAAVAESAQSADLPSAAESAPTAAGPTAPDAPAASDESFASNAVPYDMPGGETAAGAAAAIADPVQAAALAAAASSDAAPTDRPRQGGQDRRNRGPRPDADSERVVRTLAVGQEIKGTVKRVSEFGAFVDIGVGRDGLVHISELSIKRVGKVTDVINEGQEHIFWIKKLDRERNRISLTLIPPGTTTMRDLNKDDLVTGTVTRILPYGAFVDIGVGRDALLHVREMGNRFIAKPEEVVKVGEQIEARIIEIQKRRGRIDLSIKGLRDEPEPEPQAEAERGGGRGERGGKSDAPPEPEVSDIMADVEVLTPMELAFRKAMQQSGVGDESDAKSKGSKEEQRRRIRQEQEEAYQRTLKQK